MNEFDFFYLLHVNNKERGKNNKSDIDDMLSSYLQEDNSILNAIKKEEEENDFWRCNYGLARDL